MKKVLVASVIAVSLASTTTVEARTRVTPTPRLLDCIATVETEGRGHAYRSGYQRVSRSGKYHGRYQFDRRTGSGVVARAGHPEWSAYPASQWPPQVQDDAAGQLIRERGVQPWPVARRRCRP